MLRAPLIAGLLGLAALPGAPDGRHPPGPVARSPSPAAAPDPSGAPARVRDGRSGGQRVTAPAVPDPTPAQPPAVPAGELDEAFVAEDAGVSAAGAAVAPAVGPGEREARRRRARALAARHPARARARQGEDPASRRWALLVGVGEYQGGVRDTIGSVGDVRVLRQLLARGGWPDSHVLTLTGDEATGSMIRAGLTPPACG